MLKVGDTVRYKGGSCDTWIKPGAIGIVMSENDGILWAAWDKTVNPDEKVWGAVTDDVEWVSSGSPIPSDPPDTRGKKGIKFDSEKPPMDLIPYDALVEIAKVLAAGEKKYGTANWQNGIEMRRLISAALRHIGQFNSGEDLDEETETIHLANAATNLMFAIWMFKNRKDLDNRWAKPKSAALSSDEIFAVTEEIQRRGR